MSQINVFFLTCSVCNVLLATEDEVNCSNYHNSIYANIPLAEAKLHSQVQKAMTY